MRLIFLGSGEFGLPTLEFLHAHHEVRAVVSQPDRPAGRKRQLTPTPISQWAAQHDLTLRKTDNANVDDFVALMQDAHADAAIVIAFGQKLSPELITALGPVVVNLHASLLPKYRGAAPINWAMIEGETDAGVSVISLAQKMDAGLIYATRSTPIDPLETAGQLHDRLAALGPGVIQQVLDDVRADKLEGEPQNEGEATPAPKLKKADGWVDFTLTAEQVRCRIHGLTPWPGVTVIWRCAGEPVADAGAATESIDQPLILKRVTSQTEFNTAGAEPGMVLADAHVACGDGAIRLLEVQQPGKRVMLIDEFMRGHPLQPGDRLISANPG